MAIVTVGDVIGEARTLIQDTESDNYRYSDDVMYQALNEGMLESKRLRPDFFRGVYPTPQYASPADEMTDIDYPEEYRPALINYVCGRIQLQDDEATDDTRADIFLKSFAAKLTQPVA